MMVTVSLVASAVANVLLAVAAALAARAYWPRVHLPPASAARAFYVGLLLVASCLAFGSAAWTLARLAQLWSGAAIGTPPGSAARLFELVWKPGAALGFGYMLRAKLLALDPAERPDWNILSVAWHPRRDALPLRIFDLTCKRKGG